jgi:hypothetical protein
MYDIGGGLEVVSPLCPQHFLPVASIANLAKVFFLGVLHPCCFSSLASGVDDFSPLPVHVFLLQRMQQLTS